MRIHQTTLATAGLLVLSLGLTACTREPSTADSQTTEPAIAVAEPPPVEEPFAVEAIAGEESLQDNGPGTATPPAAADTDAAQAPVADAPDNSSIKATTFKAYGNEPFWNAQIDGSAVLYATLENQEGVMLTAKRSGEGNRVVYAGDNAGKPFSFTLVKRKCQDSMSGRPFDYWVSATFDGQTNTGCADGK